MIVGHISRISAAEGPLIDGRRVLNVLAHPWPLIELPGSGRFAASRTSASTPLTFPSTPGSTAPEPGIDPAPLGFRLVLDLVFNMKLVPVVSDGSAGLLKVPGAKRFIGVGSENSGLAVDLYFRTRSSGSLGQLPSSKPFVVGGGGRTAVVQDGARKAGQWL